LHFFQLLARFSTTSALALDFLEPSGMPRDDLMEMLGGYWRGSRVWMETKKKEAEI